VWEKYQEQLEEMNGARMEADEYLEARARFAVCDQPIYIFLQKYSLKLQMISKQIVFKLPCESTYVFDVNKYPPNTEAASRNEDWVSRGNEKFEKAREPVPERTGGGHDTVWHLRSTRSQSTYM
jgi:hypothetical protein